MNIKWIAGAALAAAFSVSAAQAAMIPSIPHAAPSLQKVDCAIGFHLGPAGACIIGTPDEHHDADTVIEHRAADPGCETRTIRRSDDAGNSETRTATNCN